MTHVHGLLILVLLAPMPLFGDQPQEKAPAGWHATGANPDNYDMGVDPTVAHRGKGAGFIKSKTGTVAGWGTWMQSFDAKAYLGKRIKFSAYVKTENVPDHAALWMRVDGSRKMLSFDNMNDRPIRGTSDWTQYSIVLNVPEESIDIALGVILEGTGTVWIDDVTLAEASAEAVPPATGAIAGMVKNALGVPVKNALVAAVPWLGEEAAGMTETGDDGRFELAKLPTGAYALTVTAAGLEAGYLDMVSISNGKTAGNIDLVLNKGGITFHGIVRDAKGSAGGTLIQAYRVSDRNGDVFYARADKSGQYTLTLPSGYEYLMGVQSDAYENDTQRVQGDEDRAVDITLAPVAQPQAPKEVVEWIQHKAIPLKTPEAGHGFADMEPIRKIVGDAHLVCLGEATHGTREFFQLKHRMLEFLVIKMGFTVFGIEATFPEAFDVNKYVLTGEGDPGKALDNLYFWTWNTEEVLDMIRWMRKYNEDPTHVRKVKFYGFDMQFPENAVKFTVEYLKKVDPEKAESAQTGFEILKNQSQDELKKIPQEKKDAAGAKLKEVLALFDESKDTYIRRSSADEWEIARRHVRVLQQYYEGRVVSGDVRDQSMAENIEWILKHEGPETKMVAWAHNGHVATSEDQHTGSQPMGWYLRQTLGKDMVVFGFAFNRGSFQAVDAAGGKGVHPFTVGPAPEGSLDSTLALAGLKISALDLRAIPPHGAVSHWFAEAHKTRSIGAVYNASSDRKYYARAIIADDFDALLFVEETTSAIPTEDPDQKKLIFSPQPVNLDFES
jgi:erythromycin esterase